MVREDECQGAEWIFFRGSIYTLVLDPSLPRPPILIYSLNSNIDFGFGTVKASTLLLSLTTIDIDMSSLTTPSSRSSSISSVSSCKGSNAKTNAGIGKKKFCCSFAGCGKSFSRSEHLHRHALNHKDGNHTCLRCRAHFRRRDLLGESSFLSVHGDCF